MLSLAQIIDRTGYPGLAHIIGKLILLIFINPNSPWLLNSFFVFLFFFCKITEVA